MRITNGSMPDIQPSTRRKRNVILLFVGAGGSAAVDPNEYPTTVEFFNRVTPDIKANPWFAAASRFRSLRMGRQNTNIEQILSDLRRMQDFCSRAHDISDFPGWMLAGGFIGETIPAISGAGISAISMKEECARLEKLQRAIHVLVYDLYSSTYAGHCASSYNMSMGKWVYFLRSLLVPQRAVEIFTTNYDRVLEKAIQGSGIDMKLATGKYSDDIRSWLDLNLWNADRQPRETVPARLTKLHGSVDWQRSSEELWIDGIEIGGTRFTGSHENHVIIYPGFKGEPFEEPFILFHNHLRHVAEFADAAIFVGYAFGDEYINKVLENLPFNIPKIVINKDEPLPDLSFLNNAVHFDIGLTFESAEACLKDLEQHNFTINWQTEERGTSAR